MRKLKKKKNLIESKLDLIDNWMAFTKFTIFIWFENLKLQQLQNNFIRKICLKSPVERKLGWSSMFQD